MRMSCRMRAWIRRLFCKGCWRGFRRRLIILRMSLRVRLRSRVWNPHPKGRTFGRGDSILFGFVVLEELGELFFEGSYLGDVADLDVGVVGVLFGVVLVVVFGAVEAFERGDFGDDLLREDVGGVELGDVGGGYLLL